MSISHLLQKYLYDLGMTLMEHYLVALWVCPRAKSLEQQLEKTTVLKMVGMMELMMGNLI